MVAMLALLLALSRQQNPTHLPAVQNGRGLQLVVDTANSDPALLVILPGRPRSDRAINILFPEHVTAVRRGAAEQLYFFRPGRERSAQTWRIAGQTLEYRRALAEGVELLARATLEDDGIRIRYEYTNRSPDAFDMIYAVTDPRLTAIFHDTRLERTYVHDTTGFVLIASETPARLTMPLAQWLPARYLASFTWPVPDRRVERRADGINYYNRSRAVDEPFIATRSVDGRWVVASFARTTGNVWTNPELTCQHVDPQTSLAAGGRATTEMKILIQRGSLDDALRRARAQRKTLE